VTDSDFIGIHCVPDGAVFWYTNCW